MGGLQRLWGVCTQVSQPLRPQCGDAQGGLTRPRDPPAIVPKRRVAPVRHMLRRGCRFAAKQDSLIVAADQATTKGLGREGALCEGVERLRDRAMPWCACQPSTFGICKSSKMRSKSFACR